VTSDNITLNTNYQSTFEILWSCLTIIFASNWVCVHPNVAGYKTSDWQRRWERLKLCALAIFAPEILAIFAFFQWKGCRELHKRVRKVAKGLNIRTLPAATVTQSNTVI
jgi:cytochrome bd-type quinol oxidase subunit 2